MLCFLSKEKDPKTKVRKEEIYFLSCPSGLTKDDMKMKFAQKAKLFACHFNIEKVYLHFGKEYICYDIKV